jgi:hypothetical protein
MMAETHKFAQLSSPPGLGASEPETSSVSRERRRVALAAKVTVEQLTQVLVSRLDVIESKLDRIIAFNPERSEARIARLEILSVCSPSVDEVLEELIHKKRTLRHDDVELPVVPAFPCRATRNSVEGDGNNSGEDSVVQNTEIDVIYEKLKIEEKLNHEEQKTDKINHEEPKTAEDCNHEKQKTEEDKGDNHEQQKSEEVDNHEDQKTEEVIKHEKQKYDGEVGHERQKTDEEVYHEQLKTEEELKREKPKAEEEVKFENQKTDEDDRHERRRVEKLEAIMEKHAERMSARVDKNMESCC